MILRHDIKKYSVKQKKGKLDFVKVKNFCFQNTVRRGDKKVSHNLGENIFNHISDKGSVSEKLQRHR